MSTKSEKQAIAAADAIQLEVARVQHEAAVQACVYCSLKVRWEHAVLAAYPENVAAKKLAKLKMRLQIIQDSVTAASSRVHELSHSDYEVLLTTAETALTKTATAALKAIQLRDSSSDIKYTTNLTRKARNGQLEPCFGREAEITAIIRVLCKRKKNNPALTGEPGVGKSAIIEGLTQYLINNPDKYPQLANKQILQVDLNALVAGTMYRGQFEERLQDLMSSVINSNYILFIDELHTIMGNGNNEGKGDTSNTIKPHLASGAITLIGATTLKEYKKHIEKDGALARRFDVVDVPETDAMTTALIIEKMIPLYEAHHGVTLPLELVPEIEQLGSRYLPERKFPDKALDILDALSLQVIEAATKKATREQLVSIIERMGKVKVTSANDGDPKIQVYGQNEQLLDIYQAIKTAARLKEKVHPVVLLLTGPTGTGKTFTAQQLAKAYGRPIVKLDMSEFSESFTLSRLIGSPPGYVGSEDGGQLTEAVRRNPYSLILFDEIEKAHPTVRNALLQVFDDGCLTDAAGIKVDFKNTLIFMTSNISVNHKTKVMGFATAPTTDTKKLDKEQVEAAVTAQFPPELVNRIDAIIEYKKLDDASLDQIFAATLNEYNLTAKEIKHITSKYEAFKKSDRKRLDTYGAREIKRIVNGNI